MEQSLIALGLMFLTVVGLVGAILFLTSKLGPKSTNPIKEQPFETGFVPFKVVKGRIPVKFYLVALLFVVFDVELTFLFPWALVFRELGWTAFVSMSIFLALLFLTLVYAWKKDVLSWNN
jgi:NADH-quinone oxidoreductase subunit A